jgi:hypothetical protein
MRENYRKIIGSNIWHFCSDCTTWPLHNYIESQDPRRIEDVELCVECIAQNRLRQRKCAVIVNGKECGLDLVKQQEVPIVALYQCSLGHRTYILPDFDPKNSN